MKTIFAVVVGIILLASTVFAQNLNPDIATAFGVGYGNFFAYEAVTIDDTAGGVVLTAATYTTAATVAFCTLETAEIRYRMDGGAPTTSVGHPLEPLQSIVLIGYQIPKFKGIKTGATSASLKCSYAK